MPGFAAQQHKLARAMDSLSNQFVQPAHLRFAAHQRRRSRFGGTKERDARISVQCLDRLRELAGGAIPLVLVLRQSAVDDDIELRRQVCPQGTRGGRVEGCDRVHDRQRARPREREAAGCCQIQDRAQGEDIRAPIERFAARLFGRHEGDRSQNHPRRGARYLGFGLAWRMHSRIRPRPLRRAWPRRSPGSLPETRA